jgi:thiazole synthase
MTDTNLIIAKKSFNSRLLLGTGKFKSHSELKSVIASAESEIITTAIRRVDFESDEDEFINTIDPEMYLFLPNTSGARTAEEAIRLARIGKMSGVSNWVKLEVTPEPNYLLPDPIETLKAAEQLVNEGFVVLPYINADPILAKRLEDVGCATVMPLASPIGSNRGLETKELISIIIEQAKVPVIVDAGLGAPSHAAEAMELGADAVLVNTAISSSKNPLLMAEAFKLSVKAGRMAFLSGLGEISPLAMASSPLTGFLNT